MQGHYRLPRCCNEAIELGAEVEPDSTDQGSCRDVHWCSDTLVNLGLAWELGGRRKTDSRDRTLAKIGTC